MRRLLSIMFLLTLCFGSGTASGEPFGYIVNSGSNSVSVVDLATNEVTPTVTVGNWPFGIAVSQPKNKAYITNWSGNDISIIDLATNTVDVTVSAGSKPGAVAINPAGTRLYVANYGAGSVAIVDTSTYEKEYVTVGSGPYGAAVTPDGSEVYIVNYSSDNVSVLNAASRMVEATIPVGAYPSGVAINAAGTLAYVVNENDPDCIVTENPGSVSVIDIATRTVTNTITVGRCPIFVALNPLGTKAYVTNFSDNTVSVIDAVKNKIIKTITVSENPYGINVHPDGSRAYVTYYSLGNVSVIDTAKNKVVDTVIVGNNPQTYGQFINPQYNFTALKAGSGTGTIKSQNVAGVNCGALCKAYFPPAKNITFKATPDKGSVFKSWSGECAGTKTTCTVAAEEGVVKTATAEFTQEPTISVSPLTKNFGKTKLTATKKQVFTVKNKTTTGSKELVLGAIISDNPTVFMVVPGDDHCSGATVDPNKSCKFTVQFIPAAGPQNGKVSIPSDDPDTPSLEISLSGEGI